MLNLRQTRSVRRKTKFYGDLMTFNVESLEWRRHLAGNVAVTFNNAGVLTLRGDNDANEVQVSNSGSTISIYSMSTSFTYNGSPMVTITIANAQVTDIHANLRGGNDRIGISNLQIQDDLQVALGSGNDQMTLFNVSIGDSARVVGGAGNDLITLDTTTVQGNQIVTLGSGNDTCVQRDSTVAGALRVTTGAGADAVSCKSLTVTTGPLRINTGAGHDVMIVTDTAQGPSAQIRMGGGDDTALIADVSVLDVMLVHGGGGYDELIEILPNEIAENHTLVSIEFIDLGIVQEI
ncbi:MAG: hypothetical protein KDA60_01940 [Planctomycetales bacterium]|nr:hypothetical protein [Planctomycetales bacterium]